jgi:hypothetical protein
MFAQFAQKNPMITFSATMKKQTFAHNAMEQNALS